MVWEGVWVRRGTLFAYSCSRFDDTHIRVKYLTNGEIITRALGTCQFKMIYFGGTKYLIIILVPTTLPQPRKPRRTLLRPLPKCIYLSKMPQNGSSNRC